MDVQIHLKIKKNIYLNINFKIIKNIKRNEKKRVFLVFFFFLYLMIYEFFKFLLH